MGRRADGKKSSRLGKGVGTMRSRLTWSWSRNSPTLPVTSTPPPTTSDSATWAGTSNMTPAIVPVRSARVTRSMELPTRVVLRILSRNRKACFLSMALSLSWATGMRAIAAPIGY